MSSINERSVGMYCTCFEETNKKSCLRYFTKMIREHKKLPITMYLTNNFFGLRFMIFLDIQKHK